MGTTEKLHDSKQTRRKHITEQVRIGIVGTSGWSDFLHLPSLKSSPQAAWVAICGRNRVRAAEMAQKYAIPQVFTGYRVMVDKGGLQALVVATPDDLHYPIVMDALDFGNAFIVGVLVEFGICFSPLR